MSVDKHARLESLLNTLQRRWGESVLQSGQALTSKPRTQLSTGFTALDQLLSGGLSRGQVVELLGRPTSGMTTLAYKILAQAQGLDAFGFYVDLESTFDPDYASRCGVIPERVFLARPETDLQALDIARDLLATQSVGVIALDLGHHQPRAEHLQRLTHTLTRSGCLVLLLYTLTSARFPADLARHSSGIRFLIERHSWLKRQDDIRGYQTCITLLKHQTAAGQQVTIDIDFDDTIAGEPL